MSVEEYIGLPGDLISSSDAHVEACKAGGLPWLWPELQRESLKQAVRCEFCGAVRSLVSQTHAPLPGKSPDRVLLVLACVSNACSGAPHAFAAVRCQRNVSSTTAPVQQPEDPGVSEWATVTWGSSSHGGITDASTAPPPSKSELDFGDLLAGLDKLAVSNVATQEPASMGMPGVAQQVEPPVAALENEVICAVTGPVLPEFWIGFRRVNSSQSWACSDDSHIQQLLQDYQQNAAASERAGSTTANGEQYEKTDAHTKFLEKLSLHPSQCIRYGWGMQPLWPAANVPQPGCCNQCGAACVPELQLLAPMWHFMEESLTWYDGVSYVAPDHLDASVLARPDWDWEAVVVFTCSVSCQAGTDPVCIVHEQVAAFNLVSPPGQGNDLNTIERLHAALSSEPGHADAEVWNPPATAP
eukprot:jgi/Ulvmu1/427/UM001_0434.1